MSKQVQNLSTFLRYCVGIDAAGVPVSKDTLQICISVIDTNGKVTIKGTCKVNNKVSAIDGLLSWVNKHCKEQSLPVRYVMESTGVYHEQIAWYLFQKDAMASIVLPNKAKHYLKSLGHKSKNDKIDAKGLAQAERRPMGLEQNLILWQPLSKTIYSLRMLTRQHQRLQELKNQSENQKHAVLHSQISDKFIIKQLDKLIKLYEQQIQQVAVELENLLEKDKILKENRVAEAIEKICKIKGLGLLSVATLVAETNGFEGFENIRQLISFAGYDVIENQSGQRAGKTKISKKGNSRIRRILFMPAFNAVRFGEPSCQALFKRVFERTQIKMKEYVAVQKKLLTLCFTIWKSDVEYNPMHYVNNVKEPENDTKKIAPTSGTTQNVAA
jgi:transposase